MSFLRRKEKYSPSIPTSINADPPISISASLLAAYSLFPLPQIPISKYLGITAISRKKNIDNRSSEIKKPYAPKRQQDQQEKKLFGHFLHIPGYQYACNHHKCGEQYHGDRNAIHPNMETDIPGKGTSCTAVQIRIGYTLPTARSLLKAINKDKA